MVLFINDHRAEYGVEPICAVLPIAPSTYYAHQALAADPAWRCARAKRDEALCAQIQQVWDTNQQVYGAKKVWKQLRREGVIAARCTVERLDVAVLGVGDDLGRHVDAEDALGSTTLQIARKVALAATEVEHIALLHRLAPAQQERPCCEV